jgi:hypothetical protein
LGSVTASRGHSIGHSYLRRNPLKVGSVRVSYCVALTIRTEAIYQTIIAAIWAMPAVTTHIKEKERPAISRHVPTGALGGMGIPCGQRAFGSDEWKRRKGFKRIAAFVVSGTPCNDTMYARKASPKLCCQRCARQKSRCIQNISAIVDKISVTARHTAITRPTTIPALLGNRSMRGLGPTLAKSE